MNEFGHLSDDGSEFVITTPRTPRPWINYLTNGDYCALVSHVGGGFSFYKDHRFHSLLRRGQNQAVQDLPARLWYVKDEESGETWTANVHPFGKFDRFEARHGMGYTIVSSAYAQVASELRYFVPIGTDAELCRMTLTNEGAAPRRLSIYALSELVLGNVSLEQHEGQFLSLFNEAKLSDDTIIFLKNWWHTTVGWDETMGGWPYQAVATSTRKPDAMIADANAFFGVMRTHMNPSALEPESMPEGRSSGVPLVSAMQWRVSLEPGEQLRIDTALALEARREDGSSALAVQLRDAEQHDAAWERTRAHWQELFGSLCVKTPDATINAMANHWNKLQAVVNFNFGRGPSYYHAGQYPAMRDSCQDAFGVMPLDPQLAKKNLERIARFFFADGRACGGCNRIGIPEGPSIKVDLPLWFVLVVMDYVRETGDWAFLDADIPLMDGGSSTVYAKLTAGIDRMLTECGAHGLPLIGHGDWNDAANTIGALGKGESVWLAQFLYFVIGEIMPAVRRRKEDDRAERYLRRAEELKSAVNEHCWDGEWFIRAFKDDGTPVGAKGQKEGFIWINSQTWAAISGISTAERMGASMDSVAKHLQTPHGLMNLAPAFAKPDDSIGIITRFPPGKKENAAVFSHASSFNVVARAILGRGADAVALYRSLIPLTKDQSHYEMEPYVFSQFVAGPGAGDEHGRGAYHWLTGTAAWMLRALTDYIIGVRATADGLRICPAFDPTWKHVELRRRFRGAEYTIAIENPNGVQSGVVEIVLDGAPIQGDTLPLPSADRHAVVVKMGNG